MPSRGMAILFEVQARDSRIMLQLFDQAAKHDMPGSRLTKTERRLRDWWQSPTAKFIYPTLRKLEVRGDSGIRGIRDLSLSFDYPVTVICGQNGSGKTTILSLASLAYHPPAGHHSRNARRKREKDRSHYTFSDFFYKGPDDPDILGVEITWGFSNLADVVIRKQTAKWMQYERRPERPVHYLGVSRCIPAIEQNVLRGHFKSKMKKPSANLNEKNLGRLSRIMGRSYTSVSESSSQNYRLRSCSSENNYSSFNMGAGEDILTELFLQLQETPDGSLIVVEEIEIGLHPRALTLLAAEIQEICFEKKLQIIISTHSADFIDALPREARVLIRRQGNFHNVLPSPTTRLAISSMSERNEAELIVYCEDVIASEIIRHSVRSDVLRRLNIVPVGSDSQLASQAYAHIVSGNLQHILIFWDGDVAVPQCEKFLDQALSRTRLSEIDAQRISWARLPGEAPPEKWMLSTLSENEWQGAPALADELKVGEYEAIEILKMLKTLDEHHSLTRVLAHEFSMDESEAARCLIRAFLNVSPDSANFIKNKIESTII